MSADRRRDLINFIGVVAGVLSAVIAILAYLEIKPPKVQVGLPAIKFPSFNKSYTYSLEQTLTGHYRSIVSVAFSPDGSRLASGSGDETIEIWRVE